MHALQIIIDSIEDLSDLRLCYFFDDSLQLVGTGEYVRLPFGQEVSHLAEILAAKPDTSGLTYDSVFKNLSSLRKNRGSFGASRAEGEPVKHDLIGEVKALVLIDLKGHEFRLDSTVAPVRVLDFWFIECGPCMKMQLPFHNTPGSIPLEFSPSKYVRTIPSVKSNPPLFHNHIFCVKPLLTSVKKLLNCSAWLNNDLSQLWR